jgi:hypothetical protein
LLLPQDGFALRGRRYFLRGLRPEYDSHHARQGGAPHVPDIGWR